VLHRVIDSDVFEVDAGETLPVVAQRDVMVGQELMVGLEKIDVLV